MQKLEAMLYAEKAMQLALSKLNEEEKRVYQESAASHYEGSNGNNAGTYHSKASQDFGSLAQHTSKTADVPRIHASNLAAMHATIAGHHWNAYARDQKLNGKQNVHAKNAHEATKKLISYGKKVYPNTSPEVKKLIDKYNNNIL
jgi:hypothetical protein